MDKAGALVRDFSLHRSADRAEVKRAIEIMQQFRATWAEAPNPLTKTRMGLRAMGRSQVASRVHVSQRLKRLHRIVEKLSRPEHRTMRLTQMEDIGGCRLVVPTLDDLHRLSDRVHSVWRDRIRTTQNYVEHPKPDGYRAIHVIVLRDEHLVEIQLRTQLQHLWAAHVERLEMTRGETLRRGLGSESAQATLQSMAEAFAQWESHRVISIDFAIRMLTTWLSQLPQGR